MIKVIPQIESPTIVKKTGSRLAMIRLNTDVDWLTSLAPCGGVCARPVPVMMNKATPIRTTISANRGREFA